MSLETNFSFFTLLAFPALLFLLFIPGFAALRLVLATGQISENPETLKDEAGGILRPVETIFWVLSLSIFLAAIFSFTLAELGLFSLGAVFFLELFLSLLGLFLAGRFSGKPFKTPKFSLNRLRLHPSSDQESLLVGGLLLAVFVLNFFSPHETIVGGQDSGVYFNAGAIIARTGSIVARDPLLPALAEAGGKTQPQFLLGMPGGPNRYLFVSQQRLPGFFIKDKAEGLQKGEIVPQAFHLYPALLALGMSLFGVWGGLWVTPFLGVMAVFAVYLVTRRLFPGYEERWIALFSGLFLAFNSIQVWFSRETLWETLGEFLLFTGIYGFILLAGPRVFSGAGENKPSEVHPGLARLGGLACGTAFGLICLAHSQFPFIIWPIFPYFIGVRLLRQWRPAHWWFLGAFGLLAFQTIVHIRLFSLAYFEGIYHNPIFDLRKDLHLLIPISGVLLLLLVALDGTPEKVINFYNWVLKRKRVFAVGLGLLITLYFLYGYFIRVYDISTDGQGNYPARFWSFSSYIGGLTTEGSERNLLRIGWYLSPPGILLAFLGVAGIAASRLNGRTGFFLALVLGVTVFFLDFSYTQENYIYSLRRFVPATVPAFSIFAAYACLKTLPELMGFLTRKMVLKPFRLAWNNQKVAAISNSSQSQAFYFNQVPLPGKTASLEKPVPSSTGYLLQKTKASPGKLAHLVSFSLAGFILIFLIWTGRVIFSLHEYGPSTGKGGVTEQLAGLAAKFDPKDIIIFAGERGPDAKIATPLNFIFARPSFTLGNAVKNDEVGDLFRNWEKQGYHLKALLGSNGGRFAPTGYTLKQSGETTFLFHQFQQLRIQKPNNEQDNTLTYGIYDLVKQEGKGPDFETQTGSGKVDSKPGWTLSLGQNDWPALINGFYSAEKDPDGLKFRWTDSDGAIRIPCLVPDGGPARLTITMGAGSRPASLPPLPVKIYLGNNPYDEPTFSDPKRLQPLANISLKPGVQDYPVDLAANSEKLACGDKNNSLILWLAVDPAQAWVPEQQHLGNDTRRLSLKVVKINLTSSLK